MTRKELNEKVCLLHDGQIVEIDGLMFSAIRISDDDPETPCFYCNVKSICRGNIQNVCTELDPFDVSRWYLWLES